MDLARHIEGLVAPMLEQMGYGVVRVLLVGSKRPTLQIMAERLDGVHMSVDDCAAISRAVSTVLDVEDPIARAYTLEVSSPGIDRPLTKPEDFERYAGFEARIETSRLISGRRRFRGRLVGITDTGVRLALTEGEAELSFADIARAKLVLTDDLLAATGQEKRN